MKRYSLCMLAMLGVVFAFCACGPQPRKAIYNEAAFTRYGGTGTATIKGVAFAVAADKRKMIANGFTIKCIPDNDYTDEIVKRHYWNREKLDPPDPRFAKYVRRTKADENGNFAFHGLPAGDYIVSFHANWTDPLETTDDNGEPVTEDQNSNQWVFERVSVKAGQTLVLSDEWNQGHGNIFQP